MQEQQPQPTDRDALSTAIADALVDAYTGSLVAFPFDGGFQVLPAASADNPIEIDFRDGTAKIPGVGRVESNVQTLNRIQGADNAFSGSLIVDAEPTITTYDVSRNRTGVFSPGGYGIVNFNNLQVGVIEVTSEVPFILGGALSTGIQFPFDPRPQALQLSRFGYQSPTNDNFTPVDFVPLSPTTADDLGVADLATAVGTFGNQVIQAGTPTVFTFIVENSGANAVDLIFTVQDDINEQRIADTDIHSNEDITDANAVTVNSGDTVYFESGVQSQIRNVLVKNDTAGNTSTVRIQHFAKWPVVR